MVVAHEINLPIPVRKKWRDGRLGRNGWVRRRRTNSESLGEPTYPWWRPAGYEFELNGKAYDLYRFGTIWHVEPDGKDSGTVCKHWRKVNGESVVDRSWRWHVHHWHIQVGFLGRLKRSLFERCTLCGRRYPWGYAPVSHGWNEPGGTWFKVSRRAYHHECSSLVAMRGVLSERDEAVRQLAAMARVFADESEERFVQRFWGGRGWSSETLDDNAMFRMRRGVWMLLGYEVDNDSGNLVKKKVKESATAG